MDHVRPRALCSFAQGLQYQTGKIYKSNCKCHYYSLNVNNNNSWALILDGQITFNRWLIHLCVWHSQAAFPMTAGWAAASLKPSQPFHHRHHKSLIAPRLSSFSPAINLPSHLHPDSPLPSSSSLHLTSFLCLSPASVLPLTVFPFLSFKVD